MDWTKTSGLWLPGDQGHLSIYFPLHNLYTLLYIIHNLKSDNNVISKEILTAIIHHRYESDKAKKQYYISLPITIEIIEIGFAPSENKKSYLFLYLIFQNCFRIILDWQKFDLEYSEGCTADYVLVMDFDPNQDDGEKTNGLESSKLEKICGHFETNITK